MSSITYDYIIVGAGSAGSVIANRLSADPGNKVLLVEAGGVPTFLSQIPGAYIKLFKTKIDWQFATTPQKHVLGRKIYLPRGKSLGGCSTTNAMAYVRGNRADYDTWEAMGNTGWSYEHVLPFFKRSEFADPDMKLSDRYHGHSGELYVNHATGFESAFARAFIASGAQIGYGENLDYNGESQAGFGRFQFNIKNGKRHGGFDAFIKPIMGRKNLTILAGVLTEKIEIENDTAVGITVLLRNQRQLLRANKEVIVCAGAFGSPQLLMLSGVGPKDELNKHKIKIIKEMPGVGENLQDHLFYPVSVASHIKGGLNHHGTPLGQIKAFAQYALKKKGPLTIGPLESVGFIKLNEKTKADADFQYQFTPLHIGKAYDFDMYDINSIPTNPDGCTILPSLLKPNSRGRLTLASAHATDAPIIDPKFLSHEDDLKDLIKAGKLAEQMFAHRAFNGLITEQLMPAPNATDEQWAMHIKKSLETIYHPVGTCKMGTDEMAVVDPQLRVQGIQNLRVADASIMPEIVSGNTNAPVYMIGEKAAEMILKDN